MREENRRQRFRNLTRALFSQVLCANSAQLRIVEVASLYHARAVEQTGQSKYGNEHERKRKSYRSVSAEIETSCSLSRASDTTARGAVRVVSL